MPDSVKCYIIDSEWNPGEGISQVEFKYYEDIENSGYDPLYDESIVRGRSEPHLFYSHTGADKYNFTLKFAASVDEADGRNARQIWNEHLFIKSFSYPSYGIDRKGPMRPPRKVIIQIGSWFRKRGVIESPSASFSKTCDLEGYPLFIDERFTFRVINVIPLDMFDIRQLRAPTT